MYSGNKNIKNTFLIKRYFAIYIAFSSSVYIYINTILYLYNSTFIRYLYMTYIHNIENIYVCRKCMV